jgi:hypothetical protein
MNSHDRKRRKYSLNNCISGTKDPGKHGISDYYGYFKQAGCVASIQTVKEGVYGYGTSRFYFLFAQKLLFLSLFCKLYSLKLA